MNSNFHKIHPTSTTLWDGVLSSQLSCQRQISACNRRQTKHRQKVCSDATLESFFLSHPPSPSLSDPHQHPPLLPTPFVSPLPLPHTVANLDYSHLLFVRAARATRPTAHRVDSAGYSLCCKRSRCCHTSRGRLWLPIRRVVI